MKNSVKAALQAHSSLKLKSIQRRGAITVIKIVAVQDCGLAINRLTTESQINGGVIMGLGQALLEERFMDAQTGRMLNANLEDYKVPGTFEIPEIKSIVFDTPPEGYRCR